jgi:hypothetical protein
MMRDVSHFQHLSFFPHSCSTALVERAIVSISSSHLELALWSTDHLKSRLALIVNISSYMVLWYAPIVYTPLNYWYWVYQFFGLLGTWVFCSIGYSLITDMLLLKIQFAMSVLRCNILLTYIQLWDVIDMMFGMIWYFGIIIIIIIISFYFLFEFVNARLGYCLEAEHRKDAPLWWCW